MKLKNENPQSCDENGRSSNEAEGVVVAVVVGKERLVSGSCVLDLCVSARCAICAKIPLLRLYHTQKGDSLLHYYCCVPPIFPPFYLFIYLFLFPHSFVDTIFRRFFSFTFRSFCTAWPRLLLYWSPPLMFLFPQFFFPSPSFSSIPN
uniref:Uncharacterized protein n=1 Tax=Trypanosoma congolense (strain IL3000) TaxID=1068625 RepID=G0UZQ1_TRYCI|nr:hypothetical protein, unlikely [Trypanosoma congolense IL3000]